MHLCNISEDAEDEGADRLGNMSPPYNDGASEKVQNGGLSWLAFSLTLEKAKLTMLTEVKKVHVIHVDLCIMYDHEILSPPSLSLSPLPLFSLLPGPLPCQW